MARFIIAAAEAEKAVLEMVFFLHLFFSPIFGALSHKI
jgi:hypothetical protein